MEMLFAVLLGYTIPGMAIAVGLLLMISRLGAKMALRLLGMPIIIEVGGVIIAWYMHGGTIVGGMAVVVAGICLYFSVNMARTIWGYVDNDLDGNPDYHPGWKKYDRRLILGDDHVSQEAHR